MYELYRYMKPQGRFRVYQGTLEPCLRAWGVWRLGFCVFLEGGLYKGRMWTDKDYDFRRSIIIWGCLSKPRCCSTLFRGQ